MARSARRVPSNCLRAFSASLVVRPRGLGVEHHRRIRTQHLHSSDLCCFVTDVTCGPGQYLPLGKTECSPCGPGTFSVGGGVRFEDWGEQGYARVKQSFTARDLAVGVALTPVRHIPLVPRGRTSSKFPSSPMLKTPRPSSQWAPRA